MRQAWYLVEARLDPLFNEKFMVGERNQCRPEPRTQDEVMGQAIAAGFEASYCSSYYGVESQRVYEMRRLVCARLAEEYEFNFKDVEFDVLARMWKNG